jgi:hypothetical protein
MCVAVPRAGPRYGAHVGETAARSSSFVRAYLVELDEWDRMVGKLLTAEVTDTGSARAGLAKRGRR